MAQARTAQNHLTEHATSIVTVIAHALKSNKLAHIGLLLNGELLTHGGLFVETSSDPQVVANKALIEAILSDDVLQQDFEDRLKIIPFFPLTQHVVDTVRLNIRDYYFSCIQAHESWQSFMTDKRTELHKELDKAKNAAKLLLEAILPLAGDDRLTVQIAAANRIVAQDEDAMMNEVINHIANAILSRLISLRTKRRSSQDEESILELKKMEVLKVIFSEANPMQVFEDRLIEELQRELENILIKLKEKEELPREKLVQLAETEFARLSTLPNFTRLDNEKSVYALAIACYLVNQFLTSPEVELTKSREVLNAVLIKHVTDIAHREVHQRAEKASKYRVSPTSERRSVIGLLWQEDKEDKNEKPVNREPVPHEVSDEQPTPEPLHAISAVRLTRAASVGQKRRGSLFSVFEDKRASLPTEQLPATRKEHVRSPRLSPSASDESS